MADKNFEAPAYTAAGASRESVALPATLFDGTVHMPAMHQAVKAYLANQRQGTAKTKTRSYVVGGNQKPWKQKGTGRARQGSIRAPNWVGGGTVFGPIPRSYAQYVPRQVRALARKSALNARARENAIAVVDVFNFDAPKTKSMEALLEKVGGIAKKVLVLTNGVKPNVFLSGRNMPNVHVMPYRDVSTYHILWSDLVVIEQGALTGEDAGDNASDAEQASETSDAGHQASAKKRAAPKREAKAKRAPKAEKKNAKSAKRAKSDKPAAKKAAKKKGK
jgi:large subunit ribosomal protein L4